MKKILVIVVILSILSCAGTRSKSFVIDLPRLKQVNGILGIRLFQPDGKLNVAKEQRGFLLSSLDKNELISVNHSLYATIVKNNIFREVKSLPSAGKPAHIKLYWMPRNYTVWAGGSQVKGVVYVTYCFVNAKDQVLFQEEFSVAGESFHSTVGSMKNKLNAAIVNRIVVKTVNLLHKRTKRRLALPEEYDGIRYYNDFNLAAQILPDELMLVKLASKYRQKNDWKIQFGLEKNISWQRFVDSM